MNVRNTNGANIPAKDVNGGKKGEVSEYRSPLSTESEIWKKITFLNRKGSIVRFLE